uniref:Uncharacterized protein n=1 Tax=Thermogemmatispora argillosa TaxID=2045280 RepID=A0A455T7I4_9CHLR|nr:hypothetical protein KTA_34130 [Thermogemmatispora argillosa]
MGVERAVTRWYVQRQRLLAEIESLERALAEQQREGQSAGAAQGPDQQKQLIARLEEARERLQRLGPCPKPMMG